MKNLLCLLMVLIVPAVAFSQTGTIEGTVYNKDTKAPLAGAEVRIIQTDERQKTDENGKFVFSAVPEGTYTLVTTMPETENVQRTSVVVTRGETQQTEIYFQTEQYRIEGVEVTGKRAPETVTKKTLAAEEITRLPGTAGTRSAPSPLFPVLGSQTILVARFISAVAPMRITSTTSTECPSAILTILVDLSRL